MNTLRIKNFKCFEEVEIELNKLTIFAGSNGYGKSTAIQAILLLREILKDNLAITSKLDNEITFLIKPIDINEPFLLNMGNSYNLTNHNIRDEVTFLSYESKNNKIKFNITGNDKNTLYCNVKLIQPFVIKEDIPLLNSNFHYLNTERLGPRISQKMNYQFYCNVGFQGEYTAQILADTELNYSLKIDHLKLFKNISPRLEQQVNAWLDYILPGTAVTAISDANTMTSQIKVSNIYTKYNPVLATNIGFGISYVLPIIVTCLIAPENCIVIIENPESHLHPSAQSRIGYFISKMAEAGLNIIIETHSDHVLSGIQIAAAKNEINSASVTINFFNQEEGESQPNILKIEMNEKGELSKWPTGFFDQSQRDFAELFKIRKGE